MENKAFTKVHRLTQLAVDVRTEIGFPYKSKLTFNLKTTWVLKNLLYIIFLLDTIFI